MDSRRAEIINEIDRPLLWRYMARAGAFPVRRRRMVMNVMVCIDDQNGMQFGGRRQSRDRRVTEDMIKMAEKTGTHLWISPFSEKLFQEAASQGLISETLGSLQVDTAFLEKAAEQDYCFVENAPLQPLAGRISSVTVYRWNRKYPADTWLDIDLTEWTKESTEDFAGYSHEKITKEVYRK